MITEKKLKKFIKKREGDRRRKPNPEEKHKMPAPRLQLRWEIPPGQTETKVCFYELILPLQRTDIRAESSEGDLWVRSEHRVFMGHTIVTGGGPEPTHPNPDAPGFLVSTPYRDGAHSLWDSQSLGGLPVYAVFGERFNQFHGKAD